MDRTGTPTRYQCSNSEQLEVNGKLFSAIRKKNISIQDKLNKIKKLLGKNPPPDINAQDGNDNQNTTLHMAIVRNELEVVNFLLSQGADTAIANGDGITPLQLAEECNHVDIIGALNSCVSQIERSPSQTDRLASHTSQPVAANPNNVSVFHSNSHAAATDKQTASTVLPPFSEDLTVDTELKLSNGDFKQSLKEFYANQHLTTIKQLKSTPPFPTPHVLAQFANMAYDDCQPLKPDPPLGWKFLTTASNCGMKNGYFGTAYWHPEHRQVVIAHRGTVMSRKNVAASIADVFTDVKGVVFNNYVDQMSSASTFANKVVAVLQEMEVSFELFFTGHSLGGWLAQITAFTTEYLEVKSGTFLQKLKTQQVEQHARRNVKDSCDVKGVCLKCIKDNSGTFLKEPKTELDEEHASNTVLDSRDITRNFHPHTVVFDSPGCKDMLLQMTGKLDVRLDGRSIDIEQLDITSYLAAPNRINTCNEHVGTVYRIFTDLSDMGWWEKNSTLYNLATHSIKKILESFDPQTGQVHTDGNGKLKVQVVIDWPISTGLGGGEEYKKFFKWAERYRNYHPDITGECFQYLNYSPIRYQTKLYDERVKHLRVFSEEEQEFLKKYRELRQWPEFCKPKELFFAMGDNEKSEETGKKLKSFEIENDTISCTEARALQDLIPYLKRLLQLYPEIKDIKNCVLQCETRSCVQRISRSPLEFNTDALSLREFLESEHQKVLHLRMAKGDEWTGLIKVHQVLQKDGCISEGQYIVLTLESLLTLNKLLDFSTLRLSSGAQHLMLVACKATEHLKEETRDTIRTFFETMKQKQDIKFILTSPSEGKAVALLQDTISEIFGNGFVTRDEQLTWRDLTSSSQEKLLQKSVKFQDAKISLNKIMSAECPAAEFLPLCDLLVGKELKFADPVPVSNGYNKSYYIRRTFRIQNVIKQGIWQQSQESLETVRKHIDNDSSHTYTDGDLVKLLEQAEQQIVMLISDTAGMGKSTVLTHLSKVIKENFPTKWVVRIDLNNHIDVLKVLNKDQICKKEAIELLSERLLKLKPGLEMQLFKHCCEQKQKIRIIIMLDGFDEISPFYKQAVIGLLQALRQTAVEQLWVTTRPHLRKELEDKLEQLSHTLEPFSEEDQIEFLTKFWSLKDWFSKTDIGEKEKIKNNVEIYAKKLIKELRVSISDKDRQFSGIPLQTRMLAEAFDEKVRKFCQTDESMTEINFQLDLLELYRRFIERKYEIYQGEKLGVHVDNVVAIEQRESGIKIMRMDHQLLALKVLFAEKHLTLFESNSQFTYQDEQLTRFGLVHISHDGRPHFIHRTFAEYYVADCLVNHLTEGSNTSQQLQTFILKDIFVEDDYKVIRVFVDGLLSKHKLSKEMLKQYGSRIDDLRNDCLLHTAALEGNANIIEFLLKSVRAGGQKDTASRLLVGQNTTNRTVWYLAAESGELDVVQKIWDMAIDNLTKQDIKVKLLLATDNYGNTAWHGAVAAGKPDVLVNMWDFAKDNLTTLEIKNNFLLAKGDRGNTAWHIAAKMGKLDVLQKLWDLAEHTLTKEEIRNDFLLAKNAPGNTAWHLAAGYSRTDALQKIWEWAKNHLTKEEIKNKLLLAKCRGGKTVWHCVANTDEPVILHKIWKWAKDNLTTEEINDKLLLATNRHGQTTWQRAAYWGRQYVLQIIWDLAEDSITKEEMKNKLLLAADIEGNTCWHMAADQCKQETLQQIWDLAKHHLTTEEMKWVLLLATNRKGETVWNIAERKLEGSILQKIRDWTKDSLT